jgi:hypothetical protein
MSRWLKRTIYGAGTGALVAAAVVIPEFASAEPVPECEQPRPAKCVAIDNRLSQQDDDPARPAINSVRVREAVVEDGVHTTKWVTTCVNLSPGSRLILSKKRDFLRSVAPNPNSELMQSRPIRATT